MNKVFILVGFSLLLFGCNNSQNERDIEMKADSLLITESTREGLLKIKGHKIIFAHQSVGKNIIDGINYITQELGEKLPIESLEPSSLGDKNYFVEFMPGKNEYPKTKIDGFVEQIGKLNKKYIPEVALMKLCYIDIKPDTDVNDIFKYYQKKIEKLKEENPDIMIVHLTVPLVSRSTSIKAKVKRLLGMLPWQERSNIKRHEFNVLINDSFHKNSIFDIARIESTHEDGSREEFMKDGKIYYGMSPEYTTDGGHLNKLGKHVVALEMISFLGNVIEQKSKAVN